MEELKEILSALGVSSSAIAPFLVDEKPADFDAEAAIADIVKEREEFNRTKLKPSIEADYKERTEKANYAKTIKPIQAKLSQQLAAAGATKDQIAEASSDVGIDPKKAIELLGVIATTKPEPSNETKPDERLQNALEELKKYKTLSSERAAAIEEREAAIEALKESTAAEKQAFIDGFERDSFFNTTLQSDAFKGIKKVADLPDIMKMYMNKRGYDLRRDEESGKFKPTSADGTPAIALDGKRTYKDAEEMMVDLARAGNLFPDHKGGEDRKVGNHQRVIDGKTINHQGASFLEKFL